MKKIFAVFLIIITLFLFSSCIFDNKEKETLSDISRTTATEKPTVTITVPEGLTAVQIAEKLEKNGVCSKEAFMTEVQMEEKYAPLYKFLEGVNGENKAFFLEGYIFPDTYEFYKGESAETALKRFLRNTEDKLTEEFYARADSLGYTMDEIITLASIVQSECGYPEENKKVASVLHNRISTPSYPTYGMLQCDVTVNYIENYIDKSPYIAEDTERFKELYNTYKCKGLPAGAICNPGLDCIKAALFPEATDYYFFFTDKDWNYYYNESFESHSKAYAELE